MFQGIYNGSQKHPSDLDVVLERSWATGLQKIIITVGTIADRADALEIAQKDGKRNVAKWHMVLNERVLTNRIV